MGGVKAVILAVDKYKMATGYKIIILKNDKTRFTAKCEENDCGWRIHFGPVNGDISRFVLKDFSVIHSCGVGLRSKSHAVTTNLVKHLIADNIQGDHSLKPRQIMSLFKNTYGSNIKYHHARRGKDAVIEEQFGDDEKSYSDLTWYVKAVEKTNPDSFVNFEVDHATRRFQRIFICFGACKHSYRYLRPMIYLDATFLTGRFRGALMAATCINGNNGITHLPFLLFLLKTKKIGFGFWTILNKLSMVVRLFSLVIMEKGFCREFQKYFLIHITAIAFTTSSAISLLDQVMRIRRSLLICFTKLLTLTQQLTLKKLCGACMQLDVDMLLIISGLFQRRNGQMHFFPVCRYSAHSSTLSESFNNWILDFKKLPIFALVDAICLKVMKKNSERRIEGLENFNTRRTPIYEALLKENIDIRRTWTVSESIERLYEVASPRSHSVDLLQKSCTCHRWTYQEIILPIPNYDKLQVYEPIDRVTILIPVPPPGRRRTQRIKNAWKKQKSPTICTKCFTLVHHNRATCPMP
ncbi:uncharacterized protein LOC113294901 [Papaver somniferum]|uniref:uncharacterized protein LOC113294901 n=1 Tax=Papaver somniferum TaxID=3469 RepID=UPI000E7023AD|nr:uncharacterized protein LOC113294901 [Papaver somniferum]